MYFRLARSVFVKNKSFKCVVENSYGQDKFYNERLYTSAATLREKVFNKSDIEAFKATKPQFMNDVMSFIHKYDTGIGADWFQKALDYHLIEKKPYRGVLTLFAYKALANESQLKPEDLETVRFIAWCVKLQDALYIAVDDVTDETTVRRGAPTWHCLPEVKNQFMNDYVLFESVVYALLAERIGEKEFYPALLKTLAEDSVVPFLGQTIDYRLTQQSIASHTKKMYDHAIYLKTYACFQPFSIALNLAGNKDPQLYKQIQKISTEMGRYWTLRNEYLDLDSSSFDVGRTDIKVNKLTWFSWKALEVANHAQRKILIDCYGKDDPQKEEQVKTLFLEMGLDKMWVEAENQYYSSINKIIDDMKYDNMKPVLYTFCDYIRAL